MTYLKNYLGVKCADEDVETINHAKLELAIHVTLKTTQVGAIVGGLVGGPIMTALNGKFDRDSLLANCLVASRNGMVVGALMGLPLLSFMAIRREIHGVGYYDRAYRLRLNYNQYRVDKFSLLGAAIGYGYGCKTKAGVDEKRGYAAIGLAEGVIVGAVYNRLFGDKEFGYFDKIKGAF